MNEVTLKAEAAAKPVDGGLEIAVTGADRTLAAIRRMLPAHCARDRWAQRLEQQDRPLPNGELLTVTSNDPKEIAIISEPPNRSFCLIFCALHRNS